MKRLVLFSAVLLAACGAVEPARPDAGQGADAKTPSEEQLRVEPSDPTVDAGDTLSITASLVSEDETSRDVTIETTWSSSDEDVVTLQGDDGVVRAAAVAPGEAVITARYGDLQAETTVSVRAALIDIELSPRSMVLAAGTSRTIDAVGIASTYEKRPAQDEVDWVSLDADIAQVNDQGEVEAIAAGTTTILGSADGESLGEIEIEVTGAALDALDLEVFGTELLVGGSALVRATATFADGHTQDVRTDVRWKIAEQELANDGASGDVVVVADGFVDAVQSGWADVEAVFEVDGEVLATERTGMFEVLDEDLVPTAIDVSTNEILSIHGLGAFVAATGDFGDAGNFNVNYQVSLRTSDPEAIEFRSSSANAIAARPQPVSIEAVWPVDGGDDIVGATEVSVVDTEITAIRVTHSEFDGRVTLDAVAEFGEDLEQRVKGPGYWRSSNLECVLVDNASFRSGYVDVIDENACQPEDEVTVHFGGEEGSIAVAEFL